VAGAAAVVGRPLDEVERRFGVRLEGLEGGLEGGGGEPIEAFAGAWGPGERALVPFFGDEGQGFMTRVPTFDDDDGGRD
jgi:hypothetical protein